MKSDRRLTDCMRLNLTCDPECERTVSHLQLPAPASCHRLPAGEASCGLLVDLWAAGGQEASCTNFPVGALLGGETQIRDAVRTFWAQIPAVRRGARGLGLRFLTQHGT
jgi:hypothetical protein